MTDVVHCWLVCVAFEACGWWFGLTFVLCWLYLLCCLIVCGFVFMILVSVWWLLLIAFLGFVGWWLLARIGV